MSVLQTGLWTECYDPFTPNDTETVIGLMVYLHCRIRKLIPIWTANQMTTLYRTFHIAESDSNRKCQLQECKRDQNPQW